MDDAELAQAKKLYGRLIGLERSTKRSGGIDPIIAGDFNAVVTKFGLLLKEDTGDFLIPSSALWETGSYDAEVVTSKLHQFIDYLETGYGLGVKVLEVGSLINAIQDEELRERCLDLLSAKSRFDRVVNQATLVLEDRIRTKSGVTGLEGTRLVNEVFKAKKDDSLLVLDNDEGMHEGLGHVMRGIMLSYRNQTHHSLSEMTREEALKICGFVDVLIHRVDQSRRK